MKKFTLIIIAMLSMIFASASCSGTKKHESKQETDDNARMIVCYFSATGTTEKQAKRIAELAGAQIMEIVPEAKYSEADLNWRDSLSRSSVEMADSSSRPALQTPSVNLADYDVIFIGYPNWWNTCPRIINTFIEASNLDGKKVVPFMTSGSSDIVNSEMDLAKTYPSIIWKKGLLMNNVTDDQIKDWLKTLNE